MKTSKQVRTVLLLAAVAVSTLTAAPARADEIAIPNPGFEAVQRAEGADDYNKWANNQDVWRQWTRTENGGPLRVWNPSASPTATFQGVLEYGFGGIAPEGNMVQLVYSRYSTVTGSSIMEPVPQWDGVNYFSAAAMLLDGTVGSPLAPAAPFDPTKTYTLTAAVGKPPVFVTNAAGQSSTDPRRAQTAVWHGYALQLAVGGTNVGGSTYAGRVDGGTVITQDANSMSINVDEFGNVRATFIPNAADPALAALAGQSLQIRLCALENPADFAMTGYVAFDNVRLQSFAAPTQAYWDRNDTADGSGGPTPNGTWDTANSYWNTDSTGGGGGFVSMWTPGQTAVFSAGTDATGSYTVTVNGTQSIGGLVFKDGAVTLANGTAGALELTGIATVDVASALTATIQTPITQDAFGPWQLAKTGAGTLVLSGATTYTGGTMVLDGTLRLGASNVLDDASIVTVSGRSAGTTVFDLAGNSDTVGGLVLGGSTTSSAAVVSTGAGTLTLGGDVSYVNASGTGGNPLGAAISGNLNLGVAARTFLVNNSATAAADLTVSANISGSVAMIKAGKGTLVLSGNNVAATGGMSLEEGVTQFESPAAINGAARNVAVTTPGTVVFGSSFGAGNIPAALANRIVATSDGIIAADNYASTNFDFATAGLTAAFLGAVGDVTYTGTLTPNGTTYRLGGGGGTLTIPGANALSGGANSVVIGGKVTLTDANNYGGGTTLLGGTVFAAGPVVLSIGNDAALGSGTLTFQAQPNASTVGIIRSTDGTARTLANPVVLNGGFNVSGAGNITFTDTTPIDLSATRLFVINNPVTTFAQAFTSNTGTFGITMDYTGTGTLVLAGNNSYSGTTLVNGGTLVLMGDNSAATGKVELSSRWGVPAGVVIGHDNALGAGTLTFSAVPATVAAQGTRNVANAVAANADFTIVGTDALTLSGLVTLNNNRIITNANTTNPTTFAGGITGATRSLTFAGDGDTVVSGAITTTTGTLTKNGAGTLILSGINSYTGKTTVTSGVLRLDSVGALPGGIGPTGGMSNLTFNGGVLGLAAEDFNRSLGTTASAVTFAGDGGWAAYGADRTVNLGGASGTITWATANTGFNGKTLILGAATATHTVDLQNPIDLGTVVARIVQVDNGAAAIDGKMSGVLTMVAGSSLTKTGAGTLLLSGANTYDGTTTVQTGSLEVAGALSGAGSTSVLDNASLTADSIVQNTLSIGAGGSVTIRETTGVAASSVPEPGTWALIGIGLLSLLALRRRRKV